MTREVILAALNNISEAIQFVPLRLQTAEMVLRVVQIRGMLVQYVRPDLMTREVILAALNSHAEAIEFVPLELQTPDMIVRVVGASSWPRWMAAVAGVFRRCLRGRRQ